MVAESLKPGGDGCAALWRQRQSSVHLAASGGCRGERRRGAGEARTGDGCGGRSASAASVAAPEPIGRMEIVLSGGERIIVGMDVDATALARMVRTLTRR